MFALRSPCYLRLAARSIPRSIPRQIQAIRWYSLPTVLYPMTHEIRSAACLIIGDEVLNGKIIDTNSTYFARFCFDLGIELKRVEVIPDDRQDIRESMRRLADKFDLVVTSGGIGPTHDDVTYAGAAEAFNVSLEMSKETQERMDEMDRERHVQRGPDEEARWRMALLPNGAGVKQYFPCEDLWVPVVAMDNKLLILPGVPQIFEKLLQGMKPVIEHCVPLSLRKVRYFVSTNLNESKIASYLQEVQAKAASHGVKIGSYPHLTKKVNTVSIIGRADDDAYVRKLVEDVLKHVEGKEISAQEERGRSYVRR